MAADGPGWTGQRAGGAFDCPVRTVENLRKRCVLESFELALHGHQRGREVPRRLLDGQQEAQLIALRLGPPPEGYGQWSLQLLAKQAVEFGITPSISHQTAANTLKKTASRGAASSTG